MHHRAVHLTRRFFIVLALVTPVLLVPQGTFAQSHQSTRITDPAQHRRQGDRSYPYRAKSDYILAELDLHEGDVVVDIGAGDGWWSEKFAKLVGDSGVVYAAEVAEEKVDKMSKRFAGVPQVKPRLIDTENTGLPENSCDLAFFSQSYHHLNKGGHVRYLKQLRSVVKPTGRVVIIEKYTETGLASGTHGTRLSRLVRQAEKAGWVPVRLELMTGTYHYLAILAQQELFPPEPERRQQASNEPQSKSEPQPTSTPERNKHTTDSLALVRQRLADETAILIDVREQREWDAGHLLQAILVPLSRLRNGADHGELATELAETLPKDKIIYCHCQSGGRVLAAGPILEKLGYDVRPLKDGFPDLVKAGFAAADTETKGR